MLVSATPTPTYERMEYLPLTRFTLWTGARD
jgi:hypothetical protein